MALIADRAAGVKLGRATGRGLLFIYGGVVFLPPPLGALNDSVRSWTTVWAVATAAVLLAAGTLAFSPRRWVHVGDEEASTIEPAVGTPV
jgi:hypothetical protein